MLNIKSLHTLNARGNMMLEVVRDYFNVPPEQMHIEIQALRRSVEDALALKSIKYDNLKSALIPHQKRGRKEMALVFDITTIEDSWYGRTVFSKLIPLLSKDSNHSVLAGDYLDTGAGQERLCEVMHEAVTFIRKVEYKHSSQFYIVYINNLSEKMFDETHKALLNWCSYVGYADTTYASRFKSLLSTVLANIFINHKGIIIQGHEDDQSNSENFNMSGYPFEEHGFVCRSIQSDLVGTFLSYKIERRVFQGFEQDTEFSLNAISANPQSLKDFQIEVEEAKLKYLKSEKSGSIEKSGLDNITTENLEKIIRSKISASYIYNMSYSNTHNVAKFNIIIELPAPNKCRLVAVLEYKPHCKTLRLITLY